MIHASRFRDALAGTFLHSSCTFPDLSLFRLSARAGFVISQAPCPLRRQRDIYRRVCAVYAAYLLLQRLQRSMCSPSL